MSKLFGFVKLEGLKIDAKTSRNAGPTLRHFLVLNLHNVKLIDRNDQSKQRGQLVSLDYTNTHTHGWQK